MATKGRSPKPFVLTPPEPLEDQIQDEIETYLLGCRRVDFFWRQNVGAGQIRRKDGTLTAYLKFGFDGCPDLVGWLTDGVTLLVEVKKRSVRKGSEQQEAIIAQASRCGCVALIARDWRDVHRAIEAHFAKAAP